MSWSLLVRMLWATSNNPTQMALNSYKLIGLLKWKSRSRLGILVSCSGHSGSIFPWFPGLGFPPSVSLSGWLPWWWQFQVSHQYSHHPEEEGISFIDSLLRMRKLLSQKLPATVPLASDWGHRVISEPIPMPKWMPLPIWLRRKFLNLSLERTMDFPFLKHMV